MKQQFKKKSQELLAELSATYPGLLQRYPVSLYIKDMNSYRGYYNYSFISAKLWNLFEAIEKEYQGHGLALFHKVALCSFILNTLEQLESQTLPGNIRALYAEWVERVYRDFSVQSNDYYHHRNDNFQKDLAVFSGQAIPVGGAWIVEISYQNTTRLMAMEAQQSKRDSGDAIGASVRAKISNLLKRVGLHKYIWKISRKITGCNPHYTIHTVDRFMPRITPHQMEKAYQNIAELLKINSHIQGIYRESWFLDPHLKEISPGLSFLWEIPQHNGATLFPKDSPDHVVKNAIAMSPQRKILYEQGKYLPMRYAYVWRRDDIFRWCNRQLSGEKRSAAD